MALKISNIAFRFFALTLIPYGVNAYDDISPPPFDFVGVHQDNHSVEITFKLKEGQGIAHAQQGRELWINLGQDFSHLLRGQLQKGLKEWSNHVVADREAGTLRIDMLHDFYYDIKEDKARKEIKLVLKRPFESENTSQDSPNRFKVDIFKKTTETELVLSWPEAISVVEFIENDIVVLNFSKPLDEKNLSHLSKSLPDWLSESSVSYDTLALKLSSPEVMATVKKSHNSVSIVFKEAYKQILEDLEDEIPLKEGGTPTIRESRFRGEVLKDAEKLIPSRIKFKEVIEETPDNSGALRYLAQVEEQLGRWRQGINLYNRVLKLDESSDDAKAKANLLQEYGPQIKLNDRYQHVVGQDRQLISNIYARYPFQSGFDIQAAFENRWVKSPNILRSNGILDSKVNFLKNRGQVLIGYDHESRFRTETGAYLGPGSLGVQFSEAYHWNKNKTTLEACFNKPSWDFVQGIIDRGRLHQVGLRHQYRFHERFIAEANTSYNWYALKKYPVVGETGRYGGYLDYTFRGGKPTVGLYYGLDGEYRFKRKQALDAFQQPFNLLPIVRKREVHSVLSKLTGNLPGYFHYELEGGYSKDRFGGKGWLIRGNLFYEPMPNVQVILSAGREPSLARGGSASQVKTIGGFLKLNF
jgi:tetratricopeptide (TPR) repeat protein